MTDTTERKRPNRHSTEASDYGFLLEDLKVAEIELQEAKEKVDNLKSVISNAATAMAPEGTDEIIIRDPEGDRKVRYAEGRWYLPSDGIKANHPELWETYKKQSAGGWRLEKVRAPRDGNR